MAKKAKPTNKPKTKDTVVSFRCDEDLAGRLDAHVERLLAAQPGIRWTSSSAALNLVLRGLETAEADA
jgi:hypothetical protein